jgi:16S rRNA (cytidine1402-2'-O)-methyltransferase
MVDTVLAAGLRVIPLPGPSAMVAALSVSGLLSGEFHFAGFLPTRAAQRASALRKLANIAATLVFYEAPHRVLETVQALQAELGGERMLVICRELTKQFEQVQRCRLDQAQAWLQANDNHQRGEFVLLVEGAPEQEADSGEVDRVLGLLLEQCPVKQAATLAAQILGMKKNALYDRALELKKADSKAADS